MIKFFLSSKVFSAASGECFVIGVKLADTEAHLIRILGFLLLLISAAVLIHEWHHKATAETDSTVSIPPARTSKRSHQNSRSRAPRSR